MDELVSLHIDTYVEAYPTLAIRKWDPAFGLEPDPPIRVPASLLDELAGAEEVVAAAEVAIMRYVADHYNVGDVREWLDGRTE